MQLIVEQSLPRRVALTAWMMCAFGAIYYCYEYFLRITPSVITPELMRTYHLTGAQVGSLSAFYYHAYMPMQIVVGLLMDRYGPRRLLTLACLLCAVGTYLFAKSQNIMIAELGRFLVGFGSAFAFVGALKLATIWLPANRFALVSGIITSLGMLGAIAGDIVLRSLVDKIGWETTIYISAFAGFILTFILWMFVRDANGRYQPHHNGMTLNQLFYGLWQALKNPQIWLAGIVGFLLYLSLSAFGEMWGIAYLEQAQGFSKSNAAAANSMIFLGWAVGAPFWGWFSDRIGKRLKPLAWSSFAALGVISILLFVHGLPAPMIFTLLFVFGFLNGAEIVVFAISREVSAAAFAGTAIALTNMIVMMGGNIFQPLMGKLLDLKWAGAMVEGARVYPLSAYESAMCVLPIGILLAVILICFMRETHGRLE